jgi:uncharacterized membrane protein YhaH (DUF805 family)
MKRLVRVFSFQGRSSRLGYWRTVLALTVLSAVAEGLVVGGVQVSTVVAAIAGALFLPLTVANIAVAVRRLHDRGKSAWWLIPYCAMPFGLIASTKLMAFETEPVRGTTAVIVLTLVLTAAVLTIWGWIEIGFLRGQPKTNRYGAPV